MLKEKYLHSNESLKSRSHIKEFDKEYDHSFNAITKKFEENPSCEPIFIAIVGSASYGLDLEGSDLDIKGVYIQDLDSILSELKIGQANTDLYLPQIGGSEKGAKEKKKEDITLYELGRYFEMIQENNPNILELLNTPEDCIVYEHPIWTDIKNLLSTDKILTKKCYHTFHNYAIKQIKKAKGLNKKINNPIAKERKTPLDFCYVIDGHKSYSLIKFLEKNNMAQLFCGLVNIPHAKDNYALFYDRAAHRTFRPKNKFIGRIRKSVKMLLNQPLGIGYKGILNDVQPYTIYNSDGTTEEVKESSNTIRTSSTTKEAKCLANIVYNKDGYSAYNKDYWEYWGKNGWMVKRNDERYNDNTKGGQGYDGKNMSHCLRLLFMALEIAKGLGVITIRGEEHRKLLTIIKKGELAYDEVLGMANDIVDGIQSTENTELSLKEYYGMSDLPETVDLKYVQNSVLNIRKKFYKLK